MLDNKSTYVYHSVVIRYSTRQAAKKLGITHATLSHYIKVKKVPAPATATGSGMTVHLWSDQEIERIRNLLPKIANGRKTRWQKQREKQKQKTQAGAPALHKRKQTKKKK
jgi:predicted transcriptional regulator